MNDKNSLTTFITHGQSILGSMTRPRDRACQLENLNPQAKWRSVFISDIHLGTKDCKAGALNQFLKCYPCERLYLVGDVIDGWKMQKGIIWKPSFNRLLRRIFKMAKQGVKITYVTGNHDEFLRKYANRQIENIHLVNKITHLTASNEHLLVIHGDQFEGVTHCSGLLRHVGDHGYDFLMFLNRQFNRWRAHFGYGYWSFSGFLKSHIKRAQEYIHDYECAVAFGAKKRGFDGVVCGHIHHPAAKIINGIHYYNTGDWVESCTAIVEDFEGNMHLIHWLEDSRYIVEKHIKKMRKRERPKSALHPIPVPVPDLMNES